MKANYTDITIILDRSGSMQAVKSDTIGGFNQFLTSQQAVPGEATMSLVQFDNQYEVVYAAVPVADARPLDDQTFVPRGSTALLDAIGRTVNATGARLAAMPEAGRPDKVVVVILTDGLENASHEFSRRMVGQMIQHQHDVYKWEFVFLGANQDAIASAGSIGIQRDNALTYAADPAGLRAGMAAHGQNLARYRTGEAPTPGFTEADRQEQQRARHDNLAN